MNDNLSLDRSPQLVSYFAEFLQEIGLVISSIRGYAFQLIDLTMPVPQANYVCSSMSSVIHNTHRTYQTLKKVESVLAGYCRAKPTQEASLNSTNTSRHHSHQEDPFFRPDRARSRVSRSPVGHPSINCPAIQDPLFLQLRRKGCSEGNNS